MLHMKWERDIPVYTKTCKNYIAKLSHTWTFSNWLISMFTNKQPHNKYETPSHCLHDYQVLANLSFVLPSLPIPCWLHGSILWSWRWSQYILQKQWWTELHTISSQKWYSSFWTPTHQAKLFVKVWDCYWANLEAASSFILNFEAVHSSKTLVHLHWTMHCYIPNSILHTNMRGSQMKTGHRA
jgi:hypothetical protein